MELIDVAAATTPIKHELGIPVYTEFLQSYWCREPESNRHDVSTAGF
jgi:hypothetical protein